VEADADGDSASVKALKARARQLEEAAAALATAIMVAEAPAVELRRQLGEVSTLELSVADLKASSLPKARRHAQPLFGASCAAAAAAAPPSLPPLAAQAGAAHAQQVLQQLRRAIQTVMHPVQTVMDAAAAEVKREKSIFPPRKAAAPPNVANSQASEAPQPAESPKARYASACCDALVLTGDPLRDKTLGILTALLAPNFRLMPHEAAQARHSLLAARHSLLAIRCSLIATCAAQEIEASLHAMHGADVTAYRSHLYELWSYLTVAPEHGSEEVRKALLAGNMSAADLVRISRELREGVAL
jgi:hypothetical protein